VGAMSSRYEVLLAGPVPNAVVEVIRSRFGDVVVHREASATVVRATVVDQAALRALLSLIWDTNGSLLSVVVAKDENRRGHVEADVDVDVGADSDDE
jgi:Ni,Fe-hydrogenase III component G